MKAKNKENKEYFSLDEIKEKYTFHKEEAEKWLKVLNALEELKNDKPPVTQKLQIKRGGGQARAIQVAIEILKEKKGVVYSTTEFLKDPRMKVITTKSGRPFKTNTLAAVLGMSGVIIFDRERKYWTLKN